MFNLREINWELAIRVVAAVVVVVLLGAAIANDMRPWTRKTPHASAAVPIANPAVELRVGAPGPRGERGEPGERGETGARGEQGLKGDPGESNVLDAMNIPSAKVQGTLGCNDFYSEHASAVGTELTVFGNTKLNAALSIKGKTRALGGIETSTLTVSKCIGCYEPPTCPNYTTCRLKVDHLHAEHVHAKSMSLHTNGSAVIHASSMLINVTAFVVNSLSFSINASALHLRSPLRVDGKIIAPAGRGEPVTKAYAKERLQAVAITRNANGAVQFGADVDIFETLACITRLLQD